MNMAGRTDVELLSYVDIQHDALSVFDDVEQGVVSNEDIWVSGYKAGSSSTHGRARVALQEGGGSTLTSRDGIRLKRTSKTTFTVDVPALGIESRVIKFPRQVLHPPYKKKKPTSAPLHINSIHLAPTSQELVVGGPDGFCVVIPATPASTSGEGVVLDGHVGDVLDCRWFPSEQVVLTSSSDLSARIFASKDGANPRTLKGHTGAITATHIIDVGKEVLTASKDGTIRLWNVGTAEEVQRWVLPGKQAIEDMYVLEDEDVLFDNRLDYESRVMLAATKQGIEVVPWDNRGWNLPNPEGVGHLVSFAVSLSRAYEMLATGHSDGTVALRTIDWIRAEPPDTAAIKLVRRNESPVYSLFFSGRDLCMGTAAGLPCRLAVDWPDEEIEVEVKEELAGWDAVGIECWTEGHGSVWCAGGEGGIRRY